MSRPMKLFAMLCPPLPSHAVSRGSVSSANRTSREDTRPRRVRARLQRRGVSRGRGTRSRSRARRTPASPSRARGSRGSTASSRRGSVPGAALRPSVAPLMPRTTSMASSPSRTSATSGPRGDEVAQRRVEVALDVLGVVLVGRVAVDRALLERHDRQPRSSNRSRIVADQTTADGVGLEQDEGALDRHGRQPSRPIALDGPRPAAAPAAVALRALAVDPAPRGTTTPA